MLTVVITVRVTGFEATRQEGDEILLASAESIRYNQAIGLLTGAVVTVNRVELELGTSVHVLPVSELICHR